MKDDHAEIMQSLSDKHDVLAALIGTDHVHYLDVPMHRNIGDLLIMLGTLRFFERYQKKIDLKATYFSYRTEWAQPKDVIVFQGGGNFGDLYKGPQQVRQHLIQRLPKNRIIILPQTIHFRSRRAYDECCSAFSQHPDLHICVRDHLSYKLALPMSRNVYLLPDMAHQLWPIQRLRPSESRHLAVMRDDEERAASSVTGYDICLDWRELVGRGNKYRIRMARGVLRGLYLARVKPELLAFKLDLWTEYAERLVGDAVNLFSRFDVITTDRLHAHILACLMGIQNTVLNNSYGKNYSYVDAWTGPSNIVQVGNPHLLNERKMVPC
ncbi:MAG TPA: polysaccharide pyruvyl transferase family protein [Nitrosospira sp.]|nr:polysaccharide pyruvyl transferase family protein [Nitrosospira sp.]